jgi:hypothetical protein
MLARGPATYQVFIGPGEGELSRNSALSCARDKFGAHPNESEVA